MTDLKELPAVLVEMAMRLGIPPARYLISTRLYANRFAPELALGGYVSVTFGHDHVPTLTVWHHHTRLIFGFAEGYVALLDYQQGVDVPPELPEQDIYLPYAELLAAWPEEQPVIRALLHRALGLELALAA